MPQCRKMMQTTLGFLLLSLILMGSIVAAAGTRANVPIAFITTESARALQQTDQPPLIVDVRDRQAFAALHIRGAVNIPLTELEQRYQEIPQQGRVVLY